MVTTEEMHEAEWFYHYERWGCPPHHPDLEWDVGEDSWFHASMGALGPVLPRFGAVGEIRGLAE